MDIVIHLSDEAIKNIGGFSFVIVFLVTVAYVLIKYKD